MAMNTGNYADSTTSSASQTLDSSKIIIFGDIIHCIRCLEERNRRVDLNRANNEQSKFPEIPRQHFLRSSWKYKMKPRSESYYIELRTIKLF